MLTDQMWIDKLSQTLCFASRVNQKASTCAMCDDHGRCQKAMWETFRPEAEAVWNLLKRQGMLVQKKQNLLPGLGG